MQRLMPRFASLAFALAASTALCTPGMATSCADLAKMVPPNASITSATEESGAFEVAEGRSR